MVSSSAGEEPKRLAPKVDVARRLYLLSGNQCAYPGCADALVDEAGSWIGQVAHIEGVKGERFNSSMTNEDRRAFENLLLLCYPHHIATNDEVLYPVEAMAAMKRDHEARFAKVEEKIVQTFLEDVTALTPREPARGLGRLQQLWKYTLEPDELPVTLEQLEKFQDRLAALPPHTRSVLTTVVARGSTGSHGIVVPAHEVAQVLGLSATELNDHVAILEHHKFAGYDDDFDGTVLVSTFNADHDETMQGWPIWEDLRAFSDFFGVPLTDLMNELRFDLLD